MHSHLFDALMFNAPCSRKFNIRHKTLINIYIERGCTINVHYYNPYYNICYIDNKREKERGEAGVCVDEWLKGSMMQLGTKLLISKYYVKLPEYESFCIF